MTRMIEPPSLETAEAVPHGRTARRLEWQHLHPDVRDLVESRLGSPVREARSAGSGFTPGFASALEAEDGTRLFVKAASKQAQRQIAASYAEEARKLALLPASLPAPPLVWSDDGDRWVVLATEYVDGAPPSRPWDGDALDRCLSALTDVADATRELPEGLNLVPLHEDLPKLLTGWDDVAQTAPDWPHLAELRELARSYAELPDATHLVHADARDDNFILAADGRALLCDWNWPALGPVWGDVVDLLVTAHGAGLDAEALLASHPLTAGADPEHIDAWLAALCGYMVEADLRPVPPSSPYLGVHRRWWAAATWSWLSQRRGWS
jgi:Ser/Thr protein kinase RdoA (MazF antagonist)